MESRLVVGPGEADAAAAVIKSIYCGIPKHASVTELVLMCKLADRLQATSTEMFIQALAKLPVADWDWETAMMVSIIHIKPLPMITLHTCKPS